MPSYSAITTLFLTVSLFMNGQSEAVVFPDFVGKTVEEVVNDPDWIVLQLVAGDLDKDSHIDYVVLLEKKDNPTQNINDWKDRKSLPRILLVTHHDNGQNSVQIQNNKFIALANDGGMLPYLEPEMTIENNNLKIYYQFTRSNCWYLFGFDDECLKILYSESSGVHSATGDYERRVIDFRTGKATLETGNISDEHFKKKIQTFEVESRCLSALGEMFEWEVISGFHL